MPNELPAYSLDEILDGLTEDGEGASLAEENVRLCINGRLRRRYEEVTARIAERAAAAEAAADEARRAAAGGVEDVRLASAPPAPPATERDPEQDLADQLLEKMKRYTVSFLVRAMDSPKWNALVTAHPARIDPKTGRPTLADSQELVNSETFPVALVRLSLPEVTDAQWEKLRPNLTDGQVEKLYKVAKVVNRRDEDLPF